MTYMIHICVGLCIARDIFYKYIDYIFIDTLNASKITINLFLNITFPSFLEIFSKIIFFCQVSTT